MTMASSSHITPSNVRHGGSNPNASLNIVDGSSPMAHSRYGSTSSNSSSSDAIYTAPGSASSSSSLSSQLHYNPAASAISLTNDKSPLIASQLDAFGPGPPSWHHRRPSAASSSSSTTTPTTAASSWSSQSMVPPANSSGSSPSSPAYNVVMSSTSSPADGGIGGVNPNDTPPLHISPPTAGNSPITVLGSTVIPTEEKQSAAAGAGTATPLMNQSMNASSTGSAGATPSSSGHGTPVAEGSLPFVLSATSSPAGGSSTAGATSSTAPNNNNNNASSSGVNAKTTAGTSGSTTTSTSGSSTSASSSSNSTSRRRHSQGPDPAMRARVTGGHCFGAWRANNASVVTTGPLAELRGDKKTSGARSGRMPSLDKLLHRTTYYLPEVYHRVNPTFTYHRSANPRRVLTEPSDRVGNSGMDNTHANLVMCVNDVLHSETGPFRSFRVLELLGEGTFGQVVKCEDCETKVQVAVKVIKNKPAYHNQALMEIRILKTLNDQYDPNDQHHLLRMTDYFTYKHHLCLVFELLSVNLYELIKQNHFRGLSCHLIRTLLEQLCDTMQLLRAARVIHCDLKPENVLLVKLTSAQIKLIDFGSACMEYQTVYSYIQSRFYRSPEALLGLPYDSAIDMWSLGCIAAELFLGLPIFPGVSQYNQMYRIISMIGAPPGPMLQKGKHTAKFFNYNKDTGTYTLKTNEQWAKENNVEAVPSKVYFKGNNLRELVDLYPMRKTSSEESRLKELADRECFLHFISGLLQWDPLIRWSPAQAAQHPFVLKQLVASYDEKKFAAIRAEERNNGGGPVASSNTGGGGSGATSYPLATTLAASSTTSAASTATTTTSAATNTNARSSPNQRGNANTSGAPSSTMSHAAVLAASMAPPPPYQHASATVAQQTLAAPTAATGTTIVVTSPSHNANTSSSAAATVVPPPSVGVTTYPYGTVIPTSAGPMTAGGYGMTTAAATRTGTGTPPVAGIVVSAVPTLGSALKYGHNSAAATTTGITSGHGTRQTRAGSTGHAGPSVAWNASAASSSSASGVTLGLGLHTGGGVTTNSGSTGGGTVSQPFLSSYNNTGSGSGGGSGGGGRGDFGSVAATITTSPHHHTSYGTSGATGTGVAASFIPQQQQQPINMNNNNRSTGAFGGHNGQRRNSNSRGGSNIGSGNSGGGSGNGNSYITNPDGTTTVVSADGTSHTAFRERRPANGGNIGTRGRGGGMNRRGGGRGGGPRGGPNPNGPNVAFGHHSHHLSNAAAHGGIHLAGGTNSPLYLHGGGGGGGGGGAGGISHAYGPSSSGSHASQHSESADTVSEQLLPPNAAHAHAHALSSSGGGTSARGTRQARAQSLDTHNMSQRPHHHHQQHGSSGHRHHHQPHHTTAYQQHQARTAARGGHQAWHTVNSSSMMAAAQAAGSSGSYGSHNSGGHNGGREHVTSTLPPSAIPSTASGGNSGLLVTTSGPAPNISSSSIASPNHHAMAASHTSPSRRGSANNGSVAINPNNPISGNLGHHRVGSGNSPGGTHHSRPGSSGGVSMSSPNSIGHITGGSAMNAFSPSAAAAAASLQVGFAGAPATIIIPPHIVAQQQQVVGQRSPYHQQQSQQQPY